MTGSSDDSSQADSGSRFLETSQAPASVSGHADQTVTGAGTIVLPATDDCRGNRRTAAFGGGEGGGLYTHISERVFTGIKTSCYR